MGTALLCFEDEFVDHRLRHSLWFMGGLMTIHADAKETAGQLALIEVLTGPGQNPPLHVHEKEDELFTIFEGCLRVFRGAEELIVESGQSVFLPRRVPHRFEVLSTSVHFLVAITPAGFEDYFRRLGKPARRLSPDVNPAPLNVKRLVEQGAEFGVTFPGLGS